MRKNISMTIVANMTSNYGEGLGNVSSVQKVFRRGKTYAIRSKESLKNALMIQAGMYEDLVVNVDGATQKEANTELNVSNCRALEGGYMNTSGNTVIRNSSLYLTDAISCDEYVIETRFHNNLYMAQTFAQQNNLNLQKEAGKCGLMPYQYEYDKNLKVYSITIDLEMIGIDHNFDMEADKEEKAARVKKLLEAIEGLSLIVKGNLDNAEPILVVGGMIDRKTHYFENVINIKNNKLVISNELIERIGSNCKMGLLHSDILENEKEIEEQLKTISVATFFNELRTEVDLYFGVDAYEGA